MTRNVQTTTEVGARSIQMHRVTLPGEFRDQTGLGNDGDDWDRHGDGNGYHGGECRMDGAMSGMRNNLKLRVVT